MSTHISSKLIFLLETATNTGFSKRVLFLLYKNARDVLRGQNQNESSNLES